ncbi:MAG: molecular chaperone [Gammaproteobacteria bacterium]|nr:molecular chaperone [Gammaproteobacteria bacterium]
MRKLVFISVLTLSALIAQEAQAFRFSPFRVKFEPSGAGANQLFTVENNTDAPASVQIRIMTREVDVDGGEKNADAEKNFTIYPAQMVLKPHATRSVRVQWVGDPKLKEEKAYRIIAEQLPVNLNKEKPKTSTVKFLVTYRGALFVTPPGLAQNVTLDFSGATQDAAGKKMLEIVLHNRGTQHALLRNLKLDIKDDKNNTVSLSGENQLKGITGEGILAKHRRRFMIPRPEGLAGKVKHIEFTFDKQAF